ncbi:MAG: arginine--tRNA ligase [Candidatus Colwellbacteria bacterium CG10_big_fil_rev_8_21_14_0_10_41_28]|uniref:Arginine--tRNA ligase n=1 Tax=Candidatus Colwellbacteria bacterium CG10_big_fil_rev_8_21_14_0_10_41_28 TaxID=1974539 RepID=A0A2H0VHS2_9BACT|nr:MAG: arginine--tRNA ligase [Candidatus Colwellbacteria bacterium CG10_big_fil_rev_8_21_14_0_10_41_28]
MIKRLSEVIEKRLGTDSFEIDISEGEDRGHISTNAAFVLAGREAFSPMDAAEEIRGYLHKNTASGLFEKIEVVKPGFINIWLTEETIKSELERIVKEGSKWGKVKQVDPKTIIVEYSSPNIAKPMHVGHLRSTIIGDALANILDYLGYKVIRWNWLGDWGTQFGKLIAAYKRWGKKSDLREEPIDALNELYVRFHKELENNPELENEGREEFRKLEEGDKENRRLWRWFKKESLKEFSGLYDRLDITFDTQIGEAHYEKDLKDLIEDLKKKGIAQESEGALMIDFGDEMPQAMIRKSDGATVYLTRDIASLLHRVDEYGAREILYVVSNEQALHFQQLEGVLKKMKLEKEVKMEHIKFGLVLGEDGRKLSTREGSAIRLVELLDRAEDLARKNLEKREGKYKKSELKEMASIIGVGALKYNDLSQNRTSDIGFNWDKMLSFEGNSGPYLQYTYARLESILKKAKKIPKLNTDSLEEADLKIVIKMAQFPHILERVAATKRPHYLASYLYDLSKQVNSYYHSEPVLYSNSELRGARLNLVRSVNYILRGGLNLLGVEVVDRM